MSSVTSARANHRALPIAVWPAEDLQAWARALHEPDFLEEGGRGAEWRPDSRKAALGGYGRWLGWLATSGVNLADEPPAGRVTPDRMRAYIIHLQTGRASVTIAAALGILCMALKAMFPDDDWSWLQILQRRSRQRAKPIRDKASLLVPADKLHRLGTDLMAGALEVLAGTPNPRALLRAARDYRDGLIIALLATRPLRVKNLLGIEIGRHLRPSGTGMTLSFAAAETKNHRALHLSWPTDLVKALTHYRKQIRPLLIDGHINRNPTWKVRPLGVELFVGQGGTPLTAAGLRKALLRHTKKRFGHFVNAHLFRDCVASTIANEDPDRARSAMHLLGHTTQGTTERNYIAADGRIALAAHHDLIKSMRIGARKRAKGS